MKSLLNCSAVSLVAIMTLTTPVYAADQAQGGSFASFVPLLLIMVIFYFLLIRPQQKKLKEHRDTIEALKKGDKVITGGGIYGTITDVQESGISVKIADDVVIKVKNDTITNVVK